MLFKEDLACLFSFSEVLQSMQTQPLKFKHPNLATTTNNKWKTLSYEMLIGASAVSLSIQLLPTFKPCQLQFLSRELYQKREDKGCSVTQHKIKAPAAIGLVLENTDATCTRLSQLSNWQFTARKGPDVSSGRSRFGNVLSAQQNSCGISQRVKSRAQPTKRGNAKGTKQLAKIQPATPSVKRWQADMWGDLRPNGEGPEWNSNWEKSKWELTPNFTQNEMSKEFRGFYSSK